MISVTSPATRDAISAAPGPLSSGFYVFAEGFTIAAPMGIFCLALVSIAGLRFAASFARWPRARSVAISLGSLAGVVVSSRAARRVRRHLYSPV